MLYGLTNKRNKLLLTINTISAGECVNLSKSFLSYAEPVLQVGYFHKAPAFLYKDKAALSMLLRKGEIFPTGEGPSCIAVAPGVVVDDLEIVAMVSRARPQKSGRVILAK